MPSGFEIVALVAAVLLVLSLIALGRHKTERGIRERAKAALPPGKPDL